MSLTADQIEDAAGQLFEAERSRQQIDLLSEAFPGATIDDAHELIARALNTSRLEGVATRQ